MAKVEWHGGPFDGDKEEIPANLEIFYKKVKPGYTEAIPVEFIGGKKKLMWNKRTTLKDKK